MSVRWLNHSPRPRPQPWPRPHRNPVVNTSITESNTNTPFTTRVCVPLSWLKLGQADKTKKTKKQKGEELHCMTEAVDKCSWVHLHTGQLENARWSEKTQLSSKHQRISVMMKTHNIDRIALNQRRKNIISVPKSIRNLFLPRKGCFDKLKSIRTKPGELYCCCCCCCTRIQC